MRTYRGSRTHVLDWTEQPRFLSELAELVSPCPVEIGADALWMPRGYGKPREARLETSGPQWLPGERAWREIQDWWLVHKRGANTPNWDIAVGCTVEGRRVLVLVEAKAHRQELSPAGKRLRKDASRESLEDHEHIGRAIAKANEGWQQIDARENISWDSHYQLANRLAFAWKLGSLGIPVVLVFLGFIGDDGIADVGEPFSDDAAWDSAFANYSQGSFPIGFLDRQSHIENIQLWVLGRNRPVLEISLKR